MPAYRVLWDFAERRYVIVGPDNRFLPVMFSSEEHAKDLASAMNAGREQRLAECGS